MVEGGKGKFDPSYQQREPVKEYRPLVVPVRVFSFTVYVSRPLPEFSHRACQWTTLSPLSVPSPLDGPDGPYTSRTAGARDDRGRPR